MRAMQFILNLAVCAVLACASAGAGAADWISAPLRTGKSPASPDMAAGSLVLMPFTFTNAYRSDRQLEDMTVHIVRLDDRRGDFFFFDPSPVQAAGNARFFPAMLWLVPGKYKIERLGGMGGSRLLAGLVGQMDFTLDLQFEVPAAGEVFYLGRGDLTNVRRPSNDEQGTGWPTPIIGQSMWGFGDGTLNARRVEAMEEDWALYTELFPQLKDRQPKLQKPEHFRLDRTMGSKLAAINVLSPVVATVARVAPAAEVPVAAAPAVVASAPVAQPAASMPAPLPVEVAAVSQLPDAAAPVAVPPEPPALPPQQPVMQQQVTPQVVAVARPLPPAAHTRPVPASSGYAPADSADAVPSRTEGKERYLHYLTLPSPKAFAIYETGGWRFAFGNGNAMSIVLDTCAREGRKCWLYAVDNQVVWHESPDRRISRTDQLTDR